MWLHLFASVVLAFGAGALAVVAAGHHAQRLPEWRDEAGVALLCMLGSVVLLVAGLQGGRP